MCEKAVYTHRCGHNLNLVIITTACKIPNSEYLGYSKGSHYDVREGEVWKI